MYTRLFLPDSASSEHVNVTMSWICINPIKKRLASGRIVWERDTITKPFISTPGLLSHLLIAYTDDVTW